MATPFFEREWVRWVIFPPLLMGGCLGIALMSLVLNWIRGDAHLAIVEIGTPGFIAYAFFPMVFALAPRGQVVVAWFLYVPMMVLFGLLLIVMVGRGLGFAGLLPMLPPPPGEQWVRRDWIELGQTIVWIVFGTFSFLMSRQKARRTAESGPRDY